MTKPDIAPGTEPLTLKQRRTIAAILTARTYEKAFKSVRISRQTFYNWLKLPAFKVELDKQLNAFTDSALDRLKGTTLDAVEALRGLLASENENVRLRAAQAVIEYTIKAKEIGELSARLDEIEKHLETKGTLW